jgi:hypothetical protein
VCLDLADTLNLALRKGKFLTNWFRAITLAGSSTYVETTKNNLQPLLVWRVKRLPILPSITAPKRKLWTSVNLLPGEFLGWLEEPESTARFTKRALVEMRKDSGWGLGWCFAPRSTAWPLGAHSLG